MVCFYSKDFSVSGTTDVENSFIKEYLPISNGEAVKVYLLGLYLCKNPNLVQNESDIATMLNMTEQEVMGFFNYWEEFGLVSVISQSPLSVEYLPVKQSSLLKPRKYKAEKYTDFTKSVQALLPNRMISTNEYSEYFSIMETYSIKPEAMIMIIRYCIDKKGTEIGYHYISKVAKDFGVNGFNTVEKVEQRLSSYLLRTAELEKIFSALSVKRSPDIEDQNYFKKWTEELGFDSENIIFAAKKLKKGNMAKLDEFLMELYSTKSFAKEEISSYFDKKETVYNLAIKINKSLSVYEPVMETVISTYTNKWLSFGFDGETLLYIASFCFKKGNNSLKAMDGLVENLRNYGFITLTSVNDYFEQNKKRDEFISQMLLVAGVSRRPTNWDRENLARWKDWNFTPEMILEAAKISCGKSSPIAYMNSVLSNWKNNGVFSQNGIESPQATGDKISQEAYNLEYEKRRRKAISVAQKNTENAMEIQGFSSLYERMFGIEKDLAFAELSENTELLSKLEKEKKELLLKIDKMLKSINLCIDDLSPKFTCEKCNDTGYIGTKRCDCFDRK